VPGMTLPELAAFMDELGACVAMNLDGGGSSAMWVDPDGDADGAIVNRFSDGVERKVGNHLAVVASGDYKGCTK
jgi:exopolysaccharide biosynthesis protein